MTRTFTPDEIAVIRERHFGWEKATPSLLAAVFGTNVQHIAIILKGGDRADREKALASKIARMRAKADKFQAEADRLNAGINRDWNYWTQPIHNTSRARAFEKQRNKARERGFKAMELGCEASKLRKEADRLEKLGIVMPEDRLAAHEAKIAAVQVAPGQMVDTVHYGIREVLKVNRLSVTVKSSTGNGRLNIHKEFIRGVVT